MINKIMLVIFFLGNSSPGFSQPGKITGKIELKDLENKNTVIENTFAILISITKIDSVKIEKDLSFKFENLPAGSFKVYISPSSPPYNNKYIVHLKAGEIENINISYSSICPFVKTKNGICPICKKEDKVIPIQYGLIAEKIKKNKKPGKITYYPGGCVISGCQPSWFCERDQKEF